MNKFTRDYRAMIRKLQRELKAECDKIWRDNLHNSYVEFEKLHPELKQRRLDYCKAHPKWAKKHPEMTST